MSVSFGGLNSGLNTDRIINQLLQIERQPIRRYKQDIKQNKSTQDVFKSLNKKTGSLQDAVQTLTEPDTFKQKKASSSNSDALGVSVVDEEKATTGTDEVFVEQLAKQASVQSGQFLNDQKMVDNAHVVRGHSATTLSDFEQVSGTGTLDTSSDFLGALSKDVETTGSGTADIQIQQNDTSGNTQTVDIDLNNISDFNELEKAIEDPTSNSAASTSNSGGSFSSGDWDVDFEYDSTRDKFSMQPTNQDGFGGRALTLEDDPTGSLSASNRDKGFFQQIGFNADHTAHLYGERQSERRIDSDGDGSLDTDEAVNLVGVDGGSTFDDNRLMTNISSGDTGKISINNTDIEWDTSKGDDSGSEGFDPSNDDPGNVNELIKEINDRVDGVSAKFNSSTDKISLKTTEPGAGNISVEDVSGTLADRLNLVADGDDTNDGNTTGNNGETVFAQETFGQDSKISFNGSTVTDSDNTVRVDGLELNLKSLHPDDGRDPIEVTTEDDTSSITKDAEKFVDKFNSVIKFINKKSQENAPDSPDDSSENKSGELLGDVTSRTIKNTITRIATSRYDDAVTAGSEIENLSDVGIELKDPTSSGDTSQGTLKFDKSKFKEALNNNPDQVRQLFSAVEDDSSKGGKQDGAAVQLDSYLNSVTGSDGFISDRIDGIGDRNDRLNERIEDQKERVQRKKERLEQKFLRMEKALQRLNSQQSFVNSRL